MSESQLFLSAVAIRLAGLVLVGLALKALPQPPHETSPRLLDAACGARALAGPTEMPDNAIAAQIRDMRLRD